MYRKATVQVLEIGISKSACRMNPTGALHIGFYT